MRHYDVVFVVVVVVLFCFVAFNGTTQRETKPLEEVQNRTKGGKKKCSCATLCQQRKEKKDFLFFNVFTVKLSLIHI